MPVAADNVYTRKQLCRDNASTATAAAAPDAKIQHLDVHTASILFLIEACFFPSFCEAVERQAVATLFRAHASVWVCLFPSVYDYIHPAYASGRVAAKTSGHPYEKKTYRTVQGMTQTGHYTITHGYLPAEWL